MADFMENVTDLNSTIIIGPTHYRNYGWSLGQNMIISVLEFSFLGKLCPIQNSVCILHKLNRVYE